MNPIYGIDCAFVPPAEDFKGKQILGVYGGEFGDTPHIWTPEQIAATIVLGIKGIYVLFVPPPQFWTTMRQSLRDLLFGSPLWKHLPHFCPCYIDIERNQQDEMGPWYMEQVGHVWTDVCYNDAGSIFHKQVISGMYASPDGLAVQPISIRRILAEWLEPAGSVPQTPPTAPPAGYTGWQYAGNADSGTADLDVFSSGYRWALPDLSGTVVLQPTSHLVRA